MEKRLFVGLSIDAPWPPSYPSGRVIEESSRHLTLAFLGNCPLPNLDTFPVPDFCATAISDAVLFLPKLRPRVVSYHLKWLSGQSAIEKYQTSVLDWLETQGYKVDRRPFLPHVSIARAPFLEAEWEAHFHPLPLLITGVHLYESIGHLRYLPLFSHRFSSPFQELDHTADLAYRVGGKDYNGLYTHAMVALSFAYPPFLKYAKHQKFGSLHEIIRALNQMIAECDSEVGCPFKAVSHHGGLKEEKGTYEWEMFVDV